MATQVNESDEQEPFDDEHFAHLLESLLEASSAAHQSMRMHAQLEVRRPVVFALLSGSALS
jgi:hypothetical protein